MYVTCVFHLIIILIYKAMKKLLITLLGLLSFTFPMLAQGNGGVVVVPMENDFSAVEKVEITEAEVPATIKLAVTDNFRDYLPQKLSSLDLPYKINKDGWIGNNDPMQQQVDGYKVNILTNNGSSLEADYSADGKLIRFRQMIKNEPLPRNVQLAIADSNYKDWMITGDHEVKKGEGNHVSDQFFVKVEKANRTRNLHIDDKGILLAER